MGIRTTAKKSYPIAGNGEDPGTPSVPEVQLLVETYPSNPDKFNIVIVIKNSSSAILEKQFFLKGEDNEYREIKNSFESFDVQNVKFISFQKDRVYQIRFTLTAINSIGQASAYIRIDPANITVIDLPAEVIKSFSISRKENTSDEVNIKLNLIISEFFDISKLYKLELFYKKQDPENSQEWKIIDLSISGNNFAKITATSDKPIGYLFSYQKPISRDDIGGLFEFYIKVSFNDNTSQKTGIEDLFFNSLNTVNSGIKTDSSISTDIIDIKDSASLRYEVLAKFSEYYQIAINTISEDQNGEKSAVEDSKAHQFLDTTVYKGLTPASFYLQNTDETFSFPYETIGKGHFYPASVSEIHPCIITNKNGSGSQNTSIVLFWKINENFFDYSFFEDNISIVTNLFEVKLQYLDNGSYVDLLTNTIEITKEGVKNSKFGFFSANQKFILSIQRDVDVIKNETKQGLFDKIDEKDNSGSKLRLLVVRHDVTCSSRGIGPRRYSFDKMLIPPQWKYIAYDKHISEDEKVRSNKKINLDLNDPQLRGIRLPKKGFYEHDSINQNKSITPVYRGMFSTLTCDIKILYKLDCQYDVFYKDPVLEGTVNLIVLPQTIPKDVFLIPPSLEIPAPNLDKDGRQAEGIVKLDEYGKIAGIQITDPGSGYSLFKTVESKRQQTFTDLSPFVTQIFKIVGADLNINKQILTLQNQSFDKDNLKASLKGGVRLASSYFDRLKLQQDNQNAFSVEQKQRLDEYSNFSIPSDVEQIDNSEDLYALASTPQQKDLNSIGVLDENWNIILKLYADKNINPLQEVQIYTEDTDAGANEIQDSQISSSINYTKDSSSITPISSNSDSLQQDTDGGDPKLFALNNLEVVPDASAAAFITDKFAAPPWLTLLPTSVRADAQYGFGPLPNMAPRAEMFNRLVMGINNLNQVRVILPMVWTLDMRSLLNQYYDTVLPEGEYDLISFSRTTSTSVKVGGPLQSSSYVPINSILAASASRSVDKTIINSARSQEKGVPPGTYKVSTEDSSSVVFKPIVHPLMARSFKESYLRTFKRKILGLVTQRTATCVINQAPIGMGGYRAIGCNSYAWAESYERSVPDNTLVPIDSENAMTYFAFFDAGGTLEARASGTAQALSLRNGNDQNGLGRFCSYICGDSFSKSVDFSYAYIFPGTIKI